MEIQEIIKEINNDLNKSFNVTPRQLFNHLNLERRTWRNCQLVDDFLDQNELEIEPGYNDVWIDGNITIRHKAVAGTHRTNDPVPRVRLLESANKVPLFVSNNADIKKAISIMLMNDFSQLPVTNNGTRGLCGFLSWKTIGSALIHGEQSQVVKDYKEQVAPVVSPETTLLDAISLSTFLRIVSL